MINIRPNIGNTILVAGSVTGICMLLASIGCSSNNSGGQEADGGHTNPEYLIHTAVETPDGRVR